MNFITFSEMIGSRGEDIAKQVAAELKYSYFGEEELSATASKNSFFSILQKFDEKGPNLFERFFSEKPKIYLDRFQSMIYDEAQKGDTVFFGRGSQLLLNSFGCALHVLVTGSEEKRIEVVMAQNTVGKEVAKKIVERSDHDKRGFIRYAFDEDWLNPKLYDLIINTDKLSVAPAVNLVVGAATSNEIGTCGIDSIDLLGRLSLQRKVESALLELDINRSHIFTTVEDIKTIRLSGLVNSLSEKEIVEESVRKVAGVIRVINDIQVLKVASDF